MAKGTPWEDVARTELQVHVRKNEEQNPEGLDYRTAAQDDIDTGSQHELTMVFPELSMTRVHLSNSENIEDINSGREGHGME